MSTVRGPAAAGAGASVGTTAGAGIASTPYRWTAPLLPWTAPLVLLAVWQVASDLAWLPQRLLPAPSSVIATAWAMAASGELWRHLGISFGRAAAGFVIGGSLGLFFGLLTGLSRRGELTFDTLLQMLRTVPSLAVTPLILIWFGIDETSKIVLVAFATFFPVYMNTYHGIRSVDPQLIEMSRHYGLRGWPLVRHIILPGAVSSILVGVRYSLGVAWVVLIVAESIAAEAGIGYMAANAREFLNTNVIVLSIVLYALLGKATDALARRLEGRWLRWHENYQRRAQA